MTLFDIAAFKTCAQLHRESGILFHLSPPRGERSSKARVRGPLSESEGRKSAPSVEAPSSRPSPRVAGRRSATETYARAYLPRLKKRSF